MLLFQLMWGKRIASCLCFTYYLQSATIQSVPLLISLATFILIIVANFTAIKVQYYIVFLPK